MNKHYNALPAANVGDTVTARYTGKKHAFISDIMFTGVIDEITDHCGGVVYSVTSGNGSKHAAFSSCFFKVTIVSRKVQPMVSTLDYAGQLAAIDETIAALRIDTFAAFILYGAAAQFKHTFEYMTPLWISAQLCEVKLQAQYDIAQNLHIAALKLRREMVRNHYTILD